LLQSVDFISSSFRLPAGPNRRASSGFPSVVGSTIEVVLGGVRHFPHLTCERTGPRGSYAAHSVDPLNVGDAMENAGSIARYFLEQQPGNRRGIGCAALESFAHDLAAAIALPGRSGVMRAYFSVITSVGVQDSGRRDE